MALYLIAYDLAAPEERYTVFLSALTGAQAQRVFSCVWLLRSATNTSESLKATLVQHLGNEDRLFVCESSHWAGIHLLFDPEVFCAHGGVEDDPELVTPERST